MEDCIIDQLTKWTALRVKIIRHLITKKGCIEERINCRLVCSKKSAVQTTMNYLSHFYSKSK